jgi:hypothetical protein
MSVISPTILVVYLFVLYALGGAIYFSYHTFKIVRAAKGAGEPVLFFFTMLNNPLWRIFARKILALQSPDLKAYIFRIEIQKYVWFAFGIAMFAAAVVLVRLGVL